MGRPEPMGFPDPALAALARRVGILPGYIEQGGKPHKTSDASRRALLGALGIAAETPAAAAASLAALRAVPAAPLEPVFVVPERGAKIIARPPRRRGAKARWLLNC